MMKLRELPIKKRLDIIPIHLGFFAHAPLLLILPAVSRRAKRRNRKMRSKI
jgi:hypothetical protein